MSKFDINEIKKRQITPSTMTITGSEGDDEIIHILKDYFSLGGYIVNAPISIDKLTREVANTDDDVYQIYRLSYIMKQLKSSDLLYVVNPVLKIDEVSLLAIQYAANAHIRVNFYNFDAKANEFVTKVRILKGEM